jgi:hypothetical protein
MRAVSKAEGLVWLRPLLGRGRAELRDHLRALGVGWSEDPGNADPAFDRVRARGALAPLAGLGLGPARLAETARADGAGARGAGGGDARPSRGLPDGGARGDAALDAGPLRAGAGGDQLRLLAGALCWVAGARFRPRLAALEAACAAVTRGRLGTGLTLHGCVLRARGACVSVRREPARVAGRVPLARGVWDGRWAVDAPEGEGAEIGALGAEGLAARPRWREAGLAREALLRDAGAVAGRPATGRAAAGAGGLGPGATDRAAPAAVGAGGLTLNPLRLTLCDAIDRSLAGGGPFGERIVGNTKNIAFWIILFLLMVALFNVFSNGGRTNMGADISYSEFLDRVEGGQVAAVRLDGERVYVTSTDGGNYQTVQPRSTDVLPLLRENNVEIQAAPQEQSGFLSALGLWLPFLLLIGVWIFFMNRMQGGGRGGAMGFGKSKAKLLTEKSGKRHLQRRGRHRRGQGGAEEIVEFLRDPQKFSRPWWQDPEGRSAGRPSGHGQDAARARDRGRGGRAILHHLRLGLRRDVRGRRRQPRARHVRAG